MELTVTYYRGSSLHSSFHTFSVAHLFVMARVKEFVVGIAMGCVQLPSWSRTLRTQRCSDVPFPVPSSAHPARHGIVYRCARFVRVPMTWGLLAPLSFLVIFVLHGAEEQSSGPPQKSSMTMRVLFTCRWFGFLRGSSGGGCCLSSVPRSRLVLRTRF